MRAILFASMLAIGLALFSSCKVKKDEKIPYFDLRFVCSNFQSDYDWAVELQFLGAMHAKVENATASEVKIDNISYQNLSITCREAITCDLLVTRIVAENRIIIRLNANYPVKLTALDYGETVVFKYDGKEIESDNEIFEPGNYEIHVLYGKRN